MFKLLFLTDHSPVMFSLANLKGREVKVCGNILTLYMRKVHTLMAWKKHIISTLKNLKNENIIDKQSVWKYLKYKIRKFSKNFSK